MRALVLGLLLAFAACVGSEPVEPPDASVPKDSGFRDAGEPDAVAPVDAGFVDAGFDLPDRALLDAAAADAFGHEIGYPDHGFQADASPADAEALDAAEVDATPTDLGAPDASVLDIGAVDATASDALSLDIGAVDASGPDASAPDAVAPDASAPADSGVNLTCNPSFGSPDACGGDPTGTWTFVAACGPTGLVAQLAAACPALVLRSATHAVSGSLVAGQGAYSTQLVHDTRSELAVPLACTTSVGGCQGLPAALAQFGASATCAPSAATCDCVVNERRPLSETGNYSVSGGFITTQPLQGSGQQLYFCVRGVELRYRNVQGGPSYVLERR